MPVGKLYVVLFHHNNPQLQGSGEGESTPLWRRRAKSGCWALDTDRFEDAHSRSLGFPGENLETLTGQILFSTESWSIECNRGKHGHHTAFWKESSQLELNQQHNHSVTSASWRCRNSEGAETQKALSQNGVDIVHILHITEACRGHADLSLLPQGHR